MWVLVGCVLLLAFCLRLLFPYKWKSFRDTKLINMMPGPKGYPIFGNVLEFNVPREDLLPLFVRYFAKYGPIWKSGFLGVAAIFLCDPVDIEVVMNSTKHITKGRGYENIHSWLGTGLLTSTGEKWHKHRKLLTPAFHFKILESYVPVFNRNSSTLVDRLHSMMEEKHIEIGELLSNCTLDIISETTMGVAINAQHGNHREYVHNIKRMGELFNHRLLSFWLYHPWSYALSPSGWQESKVVKQLHQFTNKVIRGRKAEFYEPKSKLSSSDSTITSKKRLAFLDLLLEFSEANDLTDTEIREEVDTFMFEGHDTTSLSICYTLFLLGAHPAIQDKVVKELDQILGSSGREPEYADLQKMCYLEQVIKESLRLFPSVPVVARELSSDIKIRDYVVPAGTDAFILPYIVHRNPDIFPNPHVFNPDNFLPEKIQGRHPFAYLPFSAGPRNCIGQKFALLEEKAVLSAILRNFRVISLDKREDIKFLIELTLRPFKDLRFKFTPR